MMLVCLEGGTKLIDVVTIGETMVLMNPEENGSLKYVNRFVKQLGGAESNFAIALSRLNVKVGWISRLGRDSLGDYVESFIRGEGVDVSQVKRDDFHPTGLMIKERRIKGDTSVYYYRNNSAASYMQPKDLDENYIKRAKYLHITGITPALSKSCRDTVYHAINIARKYGLTIVFDPNLRLKLWDKKEMRKVVLDICSKVDIVLPGLQEGQLLFQKSEYNEIINDFLDLGVKIVVMKLGKEGCIVSNGDFIEHVSSYKVHEVVDTVGAGDGFAAGFIAGQIKGYDLVESAKIGNAVGAFAVTVKGDVEGFPTLDELKNFIAGEELVYR